MTTNPDDEKADRYERAESPRTVAASLTEITGLSDVFGHSAEWWEQRDREVAQWRARDEDAREKSRMTERAGELKDNGFPERFIKAALGELRDTPAMKLARTFVHLPRRMLILGGAVGAGKSTAAAWVLLKGQDPRPAFVRISELERRGRYDKKLDEWLKDKTSLVIDDVGAEVLDGKDVFKALLDEIVDMFYGNRRTLVMTTNLSPMRGPKDTQDQFRERYGERIWSRLTQAGEWGNCGERDLRKELQP